MLAEEIGKDKSLIKRDVETLTVRKMLCLFSFDNPLEPLSPIKHQLKCSLPVPEGFLRVGDFSALWAYSVKIQVLHWDVPSCPPSISFSPLCRRCHSPVLPTKLAEREEEEQEEDGTQGHKI
ncbi:hypothetical protein EYF80_037347 [Liparis tanakae]|uniref:Uncharacterized protein n=1 Tax=Liparis tanakae TaxID=230148 RepID=A0A4Z2GFZ0_9TELE|nr:hypothetical protein EYF80_037347 [Liparis tanakae]